MGGWRGEVEPPTKFSKRVHLTGSPFLEGSYWERGGDFFQGGCSFYKKSKLKSKIFNGKKVYKQKMFFSVLPTNLNWEILTKNLVTFKRWDGINVRMKNFNIMGVH